MDGRVSPAAFSRRPCYQAPQGSTGKRQVQGRAFACRRGPATLNATTHAAAIWPNFESGSMPPGASSLKTSRDERAGAHCDNAGRGRARASKASPMHQWKSGDAAEKRRVAICCGGATQGTAGSLVILVSGVVWAQCSAPRDFTTVSTCTCATARTVAARKHRCSACGQRGQMPAAEALPLEPLARRPRERRRNPDVVHTGPRTGKK